MTRACRRLQNTLAEHGPAALQSDEAAQRHLEECDACFAVLESLSELDAAFDALPSLDAPDGVVERLLERAEPSAAVSAPPVRTPWKETLAGGLRQLFGPGRMRLKASVALVLLAALALPFYLRSQQDLQPESEFVHAQVRYSPPDPAPPEPEPLRLDLPSPSVEILAVVGESVALDENLPVWMGTEADIAFRGGSPRMESDVSGPFDNDLDERQRVRDRLRERLRNLPRGLQEVEEESGKAEVAKSSRSEMEQSAYRVGDGAEDEDLDPRRLARRFLAGRDALEVERFLPATGYWTNTYVPGDPVLRYLQARLAERDRSAAPAGAGVPLHEGARQTTQPFDPPSDAALAVYLHADRAAVAGESRMLVQVGLVGTPAHGGRRPAMNVGVVLDLTGEVKPATAASLRALVAAFGAARDVGDRFRLIVAGPGGGEALGPDDFKHGPMTVAMQRLFSGAPPEGHAVDLSTAVRTAIRAVARGDDPAAPLGSSAVVVVTPRPLGVAAEILVEVAHASAVAGVPVSAVGVGDDVRVADLERLALAGQGSVRLLREPAEADALVGRELSAVGRAVARAVRLRIGLAPGVKLVDVVGAHRVGEAAAEKVRRAERSIDRRMARNLGIAADRGDDEPGIQIVIPTFYAGDRHVVLLDVVAPGPGPVADVTARFKDLVHLENGVARAALDLPRGESRRGPLERNVIKNLLAHQLREVLEDAGRSVVTGARETAAGQLRAHRQLLAGLGLELQGLDKDQDLGRDVAMLDGYCQLLGSAAGEDPDQLRYLSDSLRYAARLKVLPAPVVVGELR